MNYLRQNKNIFASIKRNKDPKPTATAVKGREGRAAESQLQTHELQPQIISIPLKAKPYYHWLAWPLIAVPVVISVLYVHAYGVNVAWEDQIIVMSPLFEKWYAHTLQIGDFWEQGNEHRHFFPKIVMFLLGLATRWSITAELLLIQALLISMLAVVILAV